MNYYNSAFSGYTLNVVFPLKTFFSSVRIKTATPLTIHTQMNATPHLCITRENLLKSVALSYVSIVKSVASRPEMLHSNEVLN